MFTVGESAANSTTVGSTSGWKSSLGKIYSSGFNKWLEILAGKIQFQGIQVITKPVLIYLNTLNPLLSPPGGLFFSSPFEELNKTPKVDRFRGIRWSMEA